MVPFWGHFGHTFCLPKRAGSPKVPQEAPPRIKSQAFGYHFGVKNRKKSFPEAPQTESLKMCRKSVPIGCDFDGLDLAKVWEGCSKSSFSAFEKIRKWRPTGIDFGTIFEAKSSSIEEKRGSKNRSKKGCPARLKQHSISRPGGSWRRGLACAFSTKKGSSPLAKSWVAS